MGGTALPALPLLGDATHCPPLSVDHDYPTLHPEHAIALDGRHWALELCHGSRLQREHGGAFDADLGRGLNRYPGGALKAQRSRGFELERASGADGNAARVEGNVRRTDLDGDVAHGFNHNVGRCDIDIPRGLFGVIGLEDLDDVSLHRKRMAAVNLNGLFPLDLQVVVAANLFDVVPCNSLMPV